MIHTHPPIVLEPRRSFIDLGLVRFPLPVRLVSPGEAHASGAAEIEALRLANLLVPLAERPAVRREVRAIERRYDAQARCVRSLGVAR